MTIAPEAPRVGRPRDPKLDAALLSATLELMAEVGYAALTMEAVATRAGVGKATLYRRWAAKEQLVVDALRTLSEPLEPDDTMGVRDSLVRMLESVRRKSSTSLAGQIFPRLVGDSAANPELLARYREQVLDPRRERFRSILRRGVDEGLVRPDVDVEHAIDLLVGPMAYRNLIRTSPPPGPDLAAQIVDDVLVALAPRTAPGTAPRSSAPEDSA